MGKLTAAQVKHAGPGRHGDGFGLYLYVRGGSRLWLHRYQLNGVKRYMSLGSASVLSLREAREKAAEHRRQLSQKVDPLEQRKALAVGARIAALTGTTFEQVARQYVEVRATAKKWRGDGSRREWLSTLERYAFPKIGSLPVNLIDNALVHQVLNPVWIGAVKPHVGQRLRERLERVLEFAKSSGLRQGDNPARWEGHLEDTYGGLTAATMNHAALPFAEVPAFIDELRALPGVAARALEFLILTASRTGEVRFAEWGEVNLQAGVWTIPASRMKGGKTHDVPLSDRAVEILREQLPRDDGVVFPGRSRGAVMDKDAMSDTLRRLRSKQSATIHGFRSTFKDWANATTSHDNYAVEKALAHVIPNSVERAYGRSNLLAKRWRLMNDWATYCTSPQVVGENVVPLRATGS